MDTETIWFEFPNSPNHFFGYFLPCCFWTPERDGVCVWGGGGGDMLCVGEVFL